MARPTIYSEELAAEICARVAAGKSVAAIGRQADMPAERTIWSWLADPARAGFLQAYARASVARGDVLVDQALLVAEQTLARAKKPRKAATIDGERVVVAIDKAEVGAARLLVDTLMRRAGQLAPKKYGPLIRLAGEDGGALPLIIRRERPKPEE